MDTLLRHPIRPGRLVPALLAVLASGCTMVGTTAGVEEPDPVEADTESVAEVERFFGGSVSFEGSRLPVTLDLVTLGRRAEAVLRIPDLDVRAEGTGTVREGRVELRLDYDAVCPGVVEVAARFIGDAARVEGRLTASDCTGSEEGALLLVRRSGRTLPGVPAARH